MLCPEQEALRRYYEDALDAGFAYAYRYPGMHKVLQAAGRVIRSETDRGVVLLIDKRYFGHEYTALCPPHWRFEQEDIRSFWFGKEARLAEVTGDRVIDACVASGWRSR